MAPGPHAGVVTDQRSCNVFSVRVFGYRRDVTPKKTGVRALLKFFGLFFLGPYKRLAEELDMIYFFLRYFILPF